MVVRERSAGIIIFRREDDIVKYLFLKGGGGRLDLPKGNIEEKEDVLEAARREAMEETGLGDLKIYPGFKKKVEYFYVRPDGQKVYKTVTYFLAETKSKDVKVSWEHEGYEWLTFDEAMNKIKYKSMKELLEEAENYRSRLFKSSLDRFF